MPRPSAMVTAGSAALVSVIATACVPFADPGMSGIEVRNDTKRTIWIERFPGSDGSLRLKATVGDLTFVQTDECTDRLIEAQTRSGEVVAVLDEEWCPGQIWYVRGQDDWSLEDLS